MAIRHSEKVRHVMSLALCTNKKLFTSSCLLEFSVNLNERHTNYNFGRDIN
jgi:hypothetical protein